MTDADGYYTLPYFKYFLLQNALTGGGLLPPAISPEEYLKGNRVANH